MHIVLLGSTEAREKAMQDNEKVYAAFSLLPPYEGGFFSENLLYEPRHHKHKDHADYRHQQRQF